MLTVREEENMKRLMHFELHRLCHLMDHQIASMGGDEHELTKAQCRILHFLNDNRGKDIFQRDIEDRFKIRRSTVSVMLSSMESRGYIKRLSVEQDARLKKIVLTQKASALDDQIKENIESYDRLLTEGLNEQELAQFFDVIDKIRRNIEKKERTDRTE